MDGSLSDLSKYRYERASEELDNAKAMLDTGKYNLPEPLLLFHLSRYAGGKRSG